MTPQPSCIRSSRRGSKASITDHRLLQRTDYDDHDEQIFQRRILVQHSISGSVSVVQYSKLFFIIINLADYKICKFKCMWILNVLKIGFIQLFRVRQLPVCSETSIPYIYGISCHCISWITCEFVNSICELLLLPRSITSFMLVWVVSLNNLRDFHIQFILISWNTIAWTSPYTILYLGTIVITFVTRVELLPLKLLPMVDQGKCPDYRASHNWRWLLNLT